MKILAGLTAATALASAMLVHATGVKPQDLASTVASGGAVPAVASASHAGPSSDGEAARFLAQATFGPTLNDIGHLRRIGYAAWLDEQIALPATRQLDYIHWVDRGLGEEVAQQVRMEAWFRGALGGPDPVDPARIHRDQLRQRVAFALSEIFVVSENGGKLSYSVRGAARYSDLLTDGAFGNFRTLLEAVTLSPAMGTYLSMLDNRKPDAQRNIHPDENYAREVLQLFSIGLVQLNPDGVPKRADGKTVPTYGQEAVRGFSHVFTGWTWAGCTAQNWGNCEPDMSDSGDGSGAAWLQPMTAIEAYHDRGGKQLLDYPGVALAKGFLPPGGNARSDLTAALDNIFNHPNVGPFIGRQLIQRLVTSNPSPAYVGRVALAFNDNGRGMRGDMQAVVRAILLDPEARDPRAQPAHFGKVREPLVRLTHLWRAMDARSRCGRDAMGMSHYETYEKMHYASPYRYPEWFPEEIYGQGALRSPSVFNFFRPQYAPSGEIARQGLVAPEFQITTPNLIAKQVNDTLERIDLDATASCDTLRGGYDAKSPVGSVAIDLARDTPLARDPAKLVDRYDLLFLSGQMSPSMRAVLLDRLNGITAASAGEDYLRTRVREALFLILASPDYAVQK